MRKSRVGVLACPFFFAGLLNAAIPDYFPLHQGNQWIYRSGASTFTAEITGRESIEDNLYAVMTGFPGGDWLLRMTDLGDLVFYDANQKRERLWAAFSSDSFRPEIDPCTGTGIVESRSAPYRGPIGEFSTALSVRYMPSVCADAGITREIFLPYVGLVRRSSTTIAGERSFELIYARIQGVTVITGPEVAFNLALDKSVYPAGEQITARIALRNSQQEPLRLTFGSGQTYELVVRNESGNEVYRWSAGKVFTLAIRSETIPAGERNWIVIAPNTFPAGKYVAEAWLATIAGKKFAASVEFEVR